LSTEPKQRHLARWIIIGVVVAVVVLVGGPFLYINVIEGKAPAKFTLSSSSGGGAPVPLAGTWVVATGSQVGYRVGEVLIGQNNTAVGRTSAVSGSMVISGTTVESGSFTADLTKVKSDEGSRDRQFQGRIMDTAQFPTATFVLTKPIDIGTPPADDVTKSLAATGNLTLHGVTKPISFTVTARHSGTTIEVLGSVPITFADFGIKNPSISGFVTTASTGTLEFLIDLTRGTAEAVAPTTTFAPLPAETPTGGSLAAYQQCLASKGVTLPAGGGFGGGGGGGGGYGGGGPSGASGASGASGGGAPPPGGGGPGGFPGRANLTPAQKAAVQACASLRPKGGGTPTVSPTTVPALSY